MTPARPMLCPVLDALVDWHPGEECPSKWLALDDVRVAFGVVAAPGGPAEGVHFVAPRQPAAPEGRDVRRAWAIPSVAEAFEVLQTRNLIPDGYVGRFVCGACGGAGTLRSLALDLAEMSRGVLAGRPDPCPECDAGVVDHPATMADLVAWASLGFAAADSVTGFDGEVVAGPPGVLGMEETTARLYPDHRAVWAFAARTFAMLADGSEFRFPGDGLVAITIPPLTPA